MGKVVIVWKMNAAETFTVFYCIGQVTDADT